MAKKKAVSPKELDKLEELPRSRYPFDKYMPKSSAKLIAVILLAFVLTTAAYFMGQSSERNKIEQAATVSPTPAETWKTYEGETIYTTDGSSKFSVKYPSSWIVVENRAYPNGENTTPVFVFGAGGKGVVSTPQDKEFPAGIFKYHWGKDDGFAFATLNAGRISYIFEVEGYTENESAKYEKIFNQIVSTFELTSNKSTDSSTSLCKSDDSSFCSISGEIRKFVNSEDSESIINLQRPWTVVCNISTQNAFGPEPCSAKENDGKSFEVYRVERNQAEGSDYLRPTAIKALDTQLKPLRFKYHGSLSKSDLGIVIFTLRSEGNVYSSLLAFNMARVNGAWKIVTIQEGVSTDEYENLDEKILNYRSIKSAQ